MKRASKNAGFLVPGFKFSGISSGIKKNKEKDLALIFSDVPAVTAGVFTTNKVKAAPVRLAIEKIASHKGQAILINSGNANACTMYLPQELSAGLCQWER
jgi:glutamate N-acetyltransferase/amino-acid N-acetyltransferase